MPPPGLPFEATLTNAIPPGEIGTKGVRPVAKRTPPPDAARRDVYVRPSRSWDFQGYLGHPVGAWELRRRARTDRHPRRNGDTAVHSRGRRASGASSHEISRHRRRHQWRHDTRAYRRVVSEHVARRRRRRRRDAWEERPHGHARRDDGQGADRGCPETRGESAEPDDRCAETHHEVSAAARGTGRRRETATRRPIRD